MKIFAHHRTHSKIGIIEISNGLTGREALQLEEFLYTCLDEDNCYILINFENIKKIDGLAFHVLEYFLKRGMQIRVYNVKTEILTMLDLSGKCNIIKSYNETDTDKAVSLFEKEILKKKDKVNRGVTKRCYTRVNVSFPQGFKYHSVHNGEIEGKAHILNLSEGGFLADRIIAFNLETGKVVSKPEIAGCEIHDIKFSLDGTSKLMETKGKCIWQAGNDRNICAGIRFKGMSKVYKDSIRDYVYDSYQSKNQS